MNVPGALWLANEVCTHPGDRVTLVIGSSSIDPSKGLWKSDPPA
ncbi:MAG: hypothetical protein U0359_24190 [Byssovorax sp.]